MSDLGLDAYWRWADATDYAYSDGKGGNWYVQLLIEFKPGINNGAQALLQFLRGGGIGFVAQPYVLSGSRYCTAWVARKAISTLPAFVARFKLGLAIQLPVQNDHAFDLEKFLKTKSEFKNKSLFESMKNIYRSFFPATSALFKDQKVVLAIIDDRIEINHPEFLDASNNSRIGLWWDQTSNRTNLSPVPNFGYTLLKQTLPFVDAHQLRSAYHGTHVASLAGGRTSPSYRARHDNALAAATSAKDAASDVAMAVVMLPNLTVADTSGGALGVNVLDAMTFLLQNVPATAKLVVNLSFGYQGGPHNGTSLLECALDELAEKYKDRLTIVLPAGNSFDSQCHANFDIQENDKYSLTWRVLPDDKTPSHLEIWLPTDALYKVSVLDPLGNTLAGNIAIGTHTLWRQGGQVNGGVWLDPLPANGNGKQMAFVALAPTRSSSGKPTAMHGDWIIHIHNKSASKKIEAVHAWIERDNATFGNKTRGRQSYLVDASRLRDKSALILPTAEITGYGSLNGIATGKGATVVGGYCVRTNKPAAYSGEGTLTGDVRSPDWVAPSEVSQVLKGILGASNHPAGLIRLSGTSVAAPLYTRALINASLPSLAARIVPGSHHPTGTHNKIPL
jgi:hypothetical protein